MSITYTPPPEVAAQAKRGLRLRSEAPRSQKSGTLVGITRAHQLAKQEPVSLETITRIYNFLNRNQRFKDFPYHSKARQAWYLWGGLPAFKWTKAILKKI